MGQVYRRNHDHPRWQLIPTDPDRLRNQPADIRNYRIQSKRLSYDRVEVAKALEPCVCGHKSNEQEGAVRASALRERDRMPLPVKALCARSFIGPNQALA
jgi:hypothetical protein